MTILTEEEIEIQVEKMYDKVDWQYRSNVISDEEYLAKTYKIDRWAEEQYQLRRDRAFYDRLRNS
jgi:hypothetical protein